jgi:penicillin-binding protein 1A
MYGAAFRWFSTLLLFMSKKNNAQYNRWVWIIGLAPLACIFLVLTIALLSGLPAVETLANPRINLATQVISSDSKILGAYYKENRSDIKYSELPAHLVDALLATEDVRFREHSGVDYRGLVRAIAKAGQDGGASTITQQVAKNVFLWQGSGIGRYIRKLPEIYFTFL